MDFLFFCFSLNHSKYLKQKFYMELFFPLNKIHQFFGKHISIFYIEHWHPSRCWVTTISGHRYVLLAIICLAVWKDWLVQFSSFLVSNTFNNSLKPPTFVGFRGKLTQTLLGMFSSNLVGFSLKFQYFGFSMYFCCSLVRKISSHLLWVYL